MRSRPCGSGPLSLWDFSKLVVVGIVATQRNNSLFQSIFELNLCIGGIFASTALNLSSTLEKLDWSPALDCCSHDNTHSRFPFGPASRTILLITVNTLERTVVCLLGAIVALFGHFDPFELFPEVCHHHTRAASLPNPILEFLQTSNDRIQLISHSLVRVTKLLGTSPYEGTCSQKCLTLCGAASYQSVLE